MSNSFVHSIVIQIRLYREGRNISQASMADALNLGHRTYQRIESGETVPSIEVLYRISVLLNLPIEHFVNPGSNLSPQDSFHIFDTLSDFLSNDEDKSSKIIELSNDPQLKEAFLKDDLESTRDVHEFYYADYPLYISDPKWTILNLAAQKFLNASGPRVPTVSGDENNERIGTLWGILVHGEIQYFKVCHAPTLLNGGPAIESHGIFINSPNNYFVICYIKPIPVAEPGI